jgi:colanic acid/amylovoran biosynthesis protein
VVALLLNAVTLNGGDGAIMLAIREHVRRAFGPDAELLVCDAAAATAQRLYPGVGFAVPAAASVRRYPQIRFVARAVRDLNMARWLLAARLYRVSPRLSSLLLRRLERRKLAQYASADMAISTGGTYLVEQYSLWSQAFELRLAAALGLPLVLYTQSLGPFKDAANRRRLRPALRAARLILLRDERSLRHLEELGVDTGNAHVVADSVFTFAREPTPRNGARRVAVSVRHWPFMRRAGGRERYRDAVAGLVASLVGDGADVTFVSTCQGVPEYWTDDSAEAVELVAGLPEPVREHVTVDREFRRPDELIDLLAGFDAVVSTRMHLGILALCAGVPALPIAYEFKTHELFERLGQADLVVDIEEASADALVGAYARLPARAGALQAATASERDEADRAVALLRDALSPA